MLKGYLVLVMIICLTLVSCANSQPNTVAYDKITIVSTAPSNTEILTALGLVNNLIAVDIFSKDISGINSNVEVIDTSLQDLEVLLKLAPDIVIASEFNQINGIEDPYKLLRELGTKVIYIQTAKTLEDIYVSIQQIAEITNTEDKASEIISIMRNETEKVLNISKSIERKKTVYFEIDPSLFTFGSQTFLHDLLEIAGGINIFQNESGWFKSSEEAILTYNPDVILTNINYIENHIDGIKARENWSSIKAIVNNDVYYIDANSSSRPSHNSINALMQISKALYPEYHE